MGLPESREETATSGNPVSPRIANATQDAIIGRKIPNHWCWQPPSRGLVEINCTFPTSGNFGGDEWVASANDAYLSNSIHHLSVGDQITDIGIWLLGTGGAGTCSLYLMKATGAGGGHTPIAQLDVVDPPAVLAKYTFALAAPYVVAADEAFYFTTHLALLNTHARQAGLAKQRH